jgi:hypothetical protein
LLGLVVARNNDINRLGRSIGRAEGNGGNVDVRGFLDGLVINGRVGDDQQTGFQETLVQLVSEGTGGVTTTDVGGTNSLSELEDGTLTIRTSRNNDDICTTESEKKE